MTVSVIDNPVIVQEVDDTVTVITSNTVVQSGGSSPVATPTVSGTVKIDAINLDPVVYLKASVDTLLLSYLLNSNFTWTNLSGKPSTFTPSAHTHPESDVTSLITDLGVLSSAISSEASTRSSADTALQTNISNEATTRASADTTNATAISTETTNRTNADSTHAALTTTAHGGIVASTDARLSDARTPTTHHTSHESGGTDVVTLAESQVTNLTTDLAAKLVKASNLSDVSNALTSFNNVSPLTTRGDLLTRDASNNVRLSVGSTGKFVRSDGTDPSWQVLVAGDIPNLDTSKLTTGQLLPARGGMIARGRFNGSGVNYYQTPGIGTANTNTALTLTANVISYCPMLIETPITIDQLVVEITTNIAASNLRVGIYNADTDWQPTSLVIDSGVISGATLGVKTASISTVLAPGRYLTALLSDAALGIRAVRGAPSSLQAYLTTLGQNQLASLTASLTYGALPSTGTVWTAVTSSTVGWLQTVFTRVSIP